MGRAAALPHREDVRPHPGLLPQEKGNGSAVVEGLDDRGGRGLARKSGRGLPHYRTLRADGGLPANEGWWTVGGAADGQSARQRTASPRHVAGRGGGRGFLPAGRPFFIMGRAAALPHRGDVRPLPGLLPQEKGNGSAGGWRERGLGERFGWCGDGLDGVGTGWMAGVGG